MEKLFEIAPAIIREAAKNPLALLALMMLILSVLAFFFFHKTSELTRTVIFMLIGLGGFMLVGILFSTFYPQPASEGYLSKPEITEVPHSPPSNNQGKIDPVPERDEPPTASPRQAPDNNRPGKIDDWLFRGKVK